MKFGLLLSIFCLFATSLAFGREPYERIRPNRCSVNRLNKISRIIHDYQHDATNNGDFSSIYDDFAEDVCAEIPGQANICGKDAMIATYAANTVGGLGNFVSVDPPSEYIDIVECDQALLVTPKPLYSPRSGRTGVAELIVILDFNDDGEITYIRERQDTEMLKWILHYVEDSADTFCENYHSVCGNRSAFATSCTADIDPIISCKAYMYSIPQTLYQDKISLQGNTVMCRNFMLTPLLLGYPGIGCDFVGPNSPVCF